MAEETASRLKQIIAEQLSLKPEELKSGATFDELGADSLDRVEIIMKIEEAFDLELDDDKAEKITTINELIEYVDSLKEKK
ncbi:MAG: Acyl carrier protein [candidate division TM6 bacterium GW2011_GWE2_42_60]|nr:MAG: Acyl carrier protein [candidate division TM6 bacterium GW2011_GWE2_42_60]HBY05497.1 acyl carrier protein [Candidatus Dependentiae bacterium]